MVAKKVKRKSKRSQTKYPGLDPKVNRGNVRDVIDFDYIDKLSEEEKAFLDKFSTEYYTADFRPTKTRRTPLHKGKKARRKIYKTNNDRNSDTTSYLWNYGALGSYEDLTDSDLKSRSPEEALIAVIDRTPKKAKSRR